MASIVDKVRKWMRDQEDRRYLSQLGGPETSDLGLCKTDLMTIASAPGDTRERMEKMAQACGLDSAALNAEHWRHTDMARACGLCDERDVCKRWLNGQESDTDITDFCPNAEHFSKLAALHSAGLNAASKNKKRDG